MGMPIKTPIRTAAMSATYSGTVTVCENIKIPWKSIPSFEAYLSVSEVSWESSVNSNKILFSLLVAFFLSQKGIFRRNLSDTKSEPVEWRKFIPRKFRNNALASVVTYWCTIPHRCFRKQVQSTPKHKLKQSKASFDKIFFVITRCFNFF